MDSVRFSIAFIDFSEIYLEEEHRDKDIVEKRFVFIFFNQKIFKKIFVLKLHLFSFTWTRCLFRIL